MRRGFTLIEVTLALGIMTVGVFAIVGLYTFGYRESRQSREDVAATALADAVISPLMMAVTATNLKWSVFRKAFNYPSQDGWLLYFDRNTGLVLQDPESQAEDVFRKTIARLKEAADGSLDGEFAFPSAARSSSGMSCGLVVLHEEDSAVVRIGFRATKLPGTLLAMPIFYTEGRFQGLPDK